MCKNINYCFKNTDFIIIVFFLSVDNGKSIISLISERDMDTMEEKDKDEAVNELNGNSVGYLGYQK